MAQQDREAFLDAMIEAVATKVWRELSEAARAVLPVVGSHAALFGTGEPMPLERICEHCGLGREQVAAALDELASRGLVEPAWSTDSDSPGFRLAGQSCRAGEPELSRESIHALVDEGSVKVYGNLTVHVEEPTVELMKLTTRLAGLLAAQISATEHEADRIARKVEIVEYKSAIPAPHRPADPLP